MLTAIIVVATQAMSFTVSAAMHAAGRDSMVVAHRAALPLSLSKSTVFATSGLRVELKAVSWNTDSVLVEYRGSGGAAKSPVQGTLWVSHRTPTHFMTAEAKDGTAFQLTFTPLAAKKAIKSDPV